ncbi:hypothetical protein FLONG3_1014 [Fusarium longipes]|uniref:DUF7102 domain-containing protein n=1 Tax=Fusarium longipes TaxID=694270 RepID=A0A395T8S9_9HYPO|nr:hypothetical protein FLONG3_1014 [Fusarium longipes]
MSAAPVSTMGNRAVIEHDPEEILFYDHQGAPYRFQDQIHQLQKTAESTQPGRMVEQAGLVSTNLPRPKISFEPSVKHEDHKASADPSVSDFSVFSFLKRIRQLRVPPESLDLGYNTRGEVEEYLHSIQLARSCNIFIEWLPLAQVGIENDEGLEFPSTVSRWQTLALRKMEVSETPAPALDVVSTYDTDFLADTYTPIQIRDTFNLRDCSSPYLNPVSPPLSPASEPYEPFVLESDVAVMELTSEPSSPANAAIERLQSNAESGYLAHRPPRSPCKFSSPPTVRAAFIAPKAKKMDEFKLELKLLSSDYELNSKSDYLAVTSASSIRGPQSPLQSEDKQEGLFEEAYQTFLDSKHNQTKKLLDQERPNPADSLLRLPIPAADFDIPKPEWATHLSSSKEQFRWLAHELPSAFENPIFEGMVSHWIRPEDLPVEKVHKPFSMPSLDDLLGSHRQTLRGQADDRVKKRLLVDIDSTTATTTELTPLYQSSGIGMCIDTQEDVQRDLKRAPAPLVAMPSENCRYIVSMNLDRNILSFIERSWPQIELIDRDFAQLDTIVWPPGQVQRNVSISPLAFEADVPLCPAAGLIVTTMLRVKQRPLPGTTAMSSFRERVKLYERG